jgi:hypothetical protein
VVGVYIDIISFVADGMNVGTTVAVGTSVEGCAQAARINKKPMSKDIFFTILM